MNATLHLHLRAHRKARGLTLEHVANEIGIKQNTLSQWETGARGVDLNDLEKLAKVYGVDPMALLAAPDENPKANEMREAAALAAKLSPEDLADWLRMGRRLASPDPSEKNHKP